MKRIFSVFCVIFAVSSFYPAPGVSALTLDDAISFTKQNLPSYKAMLLKVRASGELYTASLGPYLPSLDATASRTRHFARVVDFDLRSYDLTLSYTLFDGGKRKAGRKIALLNLESNREDVRKNLLELEFKVKVAFYTAMAQRETVEQRKIQLQDARKDHDVATGRFKFGVAKLSDVLQASVRLEQARFNLVQAESDLRKAFSDLNSLMGRPLESSHPIEGSFDQVSVSLSPDRMFQVAMQRPEIIKAGKAVKIAENNLDLSRSAFFPVLSVSASYTRTEGGFFKIFFPEEKTAGISATWNLFELGKFFRYRSFRAEEEASLQELSEAKRQVFLEVARAYEDFVTASNKIKLAEEQLRQAEHNYSQAFGEYKVGKADILSLVQAESFLSNAREQLIASKLNLFLSKPQWHNKFQRSWPRKFHSRTSLM